MDPNETLKLIRSAIAREDWEFAAVLADALDKWLTSGGYLPDAWKSE